jgi:hypothetical protein
MCSLANPALSSAVVGPVPQTEFPPELQPFLTFLEEPFGLPVCLVCQSAVLPKSLMDHLRKQHQLPADLRTAVRTLVATLPPLSTSDLATKPNGSPPLKALRISEAFQCKHCSFIRRDLTDVRKHINKEHGLSATGSYDQVQAQSWLGGRNAIYWRVEQHLTPKVIEEGPPCVWGFFGGGWGDKTPRQWPQLLSENPNPNQGGNT